MDFKLLHTSFRHSGDKEYKWFYANIVFKVFDWELKKRCEGLCEKWTKTTFYNVEDPEYIHQCYLNADVSFTDIEGSDLKSMDITYHPDYDIEKISQSGWTVNHDDILVYVPKFDIFYYRQYIEDNEATRALISMINGFMTSQETSSRFVSSSTFLRCIRALDTFWD